MTFLLFFSLKLTFLGGVLFNDDDDDVDGDALTGRPLMLSIE